MTLFPSGTHGTHLLAEVVEILSPVSSRCRDDRICYMTTTAGMTPSTNQPNLLAKLPTRQSQVSLNTLLMQKDTLEKKERKSGVAIYLPVGMVWVSREMAEVCGSRDSEVPRSLL